MTRTMDDISAGDGHIQYRILRFKAVQAMIGGIARSQLDALEAAGNFPGRIHIIQRAVGWLEHEVQAWIKKQMASRRG